MMIYDCLCWNTNANTNSDTNTSTSQYQYQSMSNGTVLMASVFLHRCLRSARILRNLPQCFMRKLCTHWFQKNSFFVAYCMFISGIKSLLYLCFVVTQQLSLRYLSLHWLIAKETGSTFDHFVQLKVGWHKHLPIKLMSHYSMFHS